MVQRRFLVHRSGCEICNAPLVYNEGVKKIPCYYCEKEFDTDVYCAKGHYVCDECNRVDANNLIVKECLKYKGLNPIVFANDLLEHPLVNMHGPEHHFMVPAVLFTVYNNLKKVSDNPAQVLQILRSRMVKIPGGICATHGGCGAIMGFGAFVSYITGVSQMSGKSLADLHAVISNGLMSVSKYGGPRCCKRSTYIALLAGANWLKEVLDDELEMPESVVCNFHQGNVECIREGCLFYKTA